MKRINTLKPYLPDDAFFHIPPEEQPSGVTGAIVSISDPNDSVETNAYPMADDLQCRSSTEPNPIFELPPEIESAGTLPTLGEESKKNIRAAVAIRGVDALAYYVTFHAKGAQWGIYIPWSSVIFFSDEVFNLSNLTLTDRLSLSFHTILNHELFHFATDYAAAQYELLTGLVCYKSARSLRNAEWGYNTLEEGLATAWMFKRLRASTKNRKIKGVLAALKHFTDRMAPGYRDGYSFSKAKHFQTKLNEHMAAYIDSIESKPFITENLFLHDSDRLLHLDQGIDWKQCPIYILDDSKLHGIAYIPVSLFRFIGNIVETEKFRKMLEKLDVRVRRAWSKTKEKMAVSVTLHGLDFKLWERPDVYSVRVDKSYRAHLLYQRAEQSWQALEVGDHASMGHG